MYYMDNGEMSFRGSRETAIRFIQLGYTVRDENGSELTLAQLQESTDDNE